MPEPDDDESPGASGGGGGGGSSTVASSVVPPATPSDPIRIFAGTYNVRGRPAQSDNGTLETIPVEPLVAWLQHGKKYSDEPPPDLVVIGLQEVIDLTALNVVVDSFAESPGECVGVSGGRSECVCV